MNAFLDELTERTRTRVGSALQKQGAQVSEAEVDVLVDLELRAAARDRTGSNRTDRSAPYHPRLAAPLGPAAS